MNKIKRILLSDKFRKGVASTKLVLAILNIGLTLYKTATTKLN